MSVTRMHGKLIPIVVKGLSQFRAMDRRWVCHLSHSCASSIAINENSDLHFYDHLSFIDCNVLNLCRKDFTTDDDCYKLLLKKVLWISGILITSLLW